MAKSSAATPPMPNGKGEDRGYSADANEKCAPLKRARTCAAAGESGGPDHVEGDDANYQVAGLELRITR